MSLRYATGQNVDLEGLAVDMIGLGQELRGGATHALEVSYEHQAQTDDAETMTITLKVVPSEESRFAGGKPIPMDE